MDILIAIPCYDGRLNYQCVDSLVKATHILNNNGYGVQVLYLPYDPFIDRARNTCVKLFLDSGCSDLIFLDSDISFPPEAILRLLKHDKGIVAASCPMKKDDLQFCTELQFDPTTNNCLDETTGLVTVKVVGTGFMRIQRYVFEQMRQHYRVQFSRGEITPFFATGNIFPCDPKWYGEDVAFCKRWTEMGGKIYVDPHITIGHTGLKTYFGNYHDYLTSLRIEG